MQEKKKHVKVMIRVQKDKSFFLLDARKEKRKQKTNKQGRINWKDQTRVLNFLKYTRDGAARVTKDQAAEAKQASSCFQKDIIPL